MTANDAWMVADRLDGYYRCRCASLSKGRDCHTDYDPCALTLDLQWAAEGLHQLANGMEATESDNPCIDSIRKELMNADKKQTFYQLDVDMLNVLPSAAQFRRMNSEFRYNPSLARKMMEKGWKFVELTEKDLPEYLEKYRRAINTADSQMNGE